MQFSRYVSRKTIVTKTKVATTKHASLNNKEPSFLHHAQGLRKRNHLPILTNVVGFKVFRQLFPGRRHRFAVSTPGGEKFDEGDALFRGVAFHFAIHMIGECDFAQCRQAIFDLNDVVAL